MMDKAQWTDYREAVIRQVTAKLDAIEPIAEVMDAYEAEFRGAFEIAGDGHFTDRTTVGPTPLSVVDDED